MQKQNAPDGDREQRRPVRSAVRLNELGLGQRDPVGPEQLADSFNERHLGNRGLFWGDVGTS